MDTSRPGGPVERVGAAYRDAKADALYASAVRLRWRRRQLARGTDDESKARLRAVTEELHRRGRGVDR